MKKTGITLLIGMAIGFIVSVGIYFSIISNAFSNNDKKPPIITHDMALERVKEVAKIVSVEYYMADLVSYNNSRIWPFSDQKILVIAKAKILAGFDLAKGVTVTIQSPSLQKPSSSNQALQENRTPSNSKSQLIITLPPPEIIAIQPDYKYYDIQGTPPPETHTYVLNLAKVTLYEAAKREGIFDKAKVSCRKQIQQLFSEFDVMVNFSDEETKIEG